MCSHLCEICGTTKEPNATITTSLIPKILWGSSWQPKKNQDHGTVSLSDQQAGMGKRMGDKHQRSMPRWVEEERIAAKRLSGHALGVKGAGGQK